MSPSGQALIEHLGQGGAGGRGHEDGEHTSGGDESWFLMLGCRRPTSRRVSGRSSSGDQLCCVLFLLWERGEGGGGEGEAFWLHGARFGGMKAADDFVA